MEKFIKKIEVDTQKIYISSNSLILKTENFLSKTKNILDIDLFISKIAESLIKNFDTIFLPNQLNKNNNPETFYMVETADKSFSLFIKFGFQIYGHNKKDIIYCNFLSKNNQIYQNDTKIKLFLQNHSSFNVWISPTSKLNNNVNLSKLYRLTFNHEINFPMLSPEQLSLVTTDNQNVIVQGVAGSGKTNVCIEKLVWVASKNYGGKILYTTFSRGLLNDTKLKVDAFKNSLKQFLQSYKNGQVAFLDNDHKKAIENFLGIFFFVNDDDIIKKIEQMIWFFENRIDYFLIEDLYKNNFENIDFANEEFFIKTYLKKTNNHQIEKLLLKIKHLSNEIIYKEIFGVVFGYFDAKTQTRLKENEYIDLRKNSFQKYECEAIYKIALDYEKYLTTNKFTNNNLASAKMLQNYKKINEYSLVIADEVQDFSQINLLLFKKISLKMFCTGDALQMINPSYFSFRYLKNLLFEENGTSVAELKNNFRNTLKIQQIIDGLEEINIKTFGTHNFISSGKAIDSNNQTTAIYCNSSNFIDLISKTKYDSFTVVVNSKEQKEILRKQLKNQEILTTAEIKGLERDTVLLYNLLSDNAEKWAKINNMLINKKQADENSVFRYYFNTFYVGISRARHNLFVVERASLPLFTELFKKHFNCLDVQNAINSLSKIISKIEYTQAEYLDRISQFLKLEQFDNARFTANKITDDVVRKNLQTKIDIFENFVHCGKNREAGIKFWENGMIEEAKKQFIISNDTILVDLIDAVSQKNQTNLSYAIVKYFNEVNGNDVAQKFILDTILSDLENLKQTQAELHEKFKKIRSYKNGK